MDLLRARSLVVAGDVEGAVHPAKRIQDVVLDPGPHVNLAGDGLAEELLRSGEEGGGEEDDRGAAVEELEGGVVDGEVVHLQEGLGRARDGLQDLAHVGEEDGGEEDLEEGGGGPSAADARLDGSPRAGAHHAAHRRPHDPPGAAEADPAGTDVPRRSRSRSNDAAGAGQLRHRSRARRA